ncbi:MAG: hypothetical protein LBS83_02865 [Holosporales bacterium]|jgi:hypothetical protein|nr:hypothetical protein [Holosporales bacterium]
MLKKLFLSIALFSFEIASSGTDQYEVGKITLDQKHLSPTFAVEVFDPSPYNPAGSLKNSDCVSLTLEGIRRKIFLLNLYFTNVSNVSTEKQNCIRFLLKRNKGALQKCINEAKEEFFKELTSSSNVYLTCDIDLTKLYNIIKNKIETYMPFICLEDSYSSLFSIRISFDKMRYDRVKELFQKNLSEIEVAFYYFFCQIGSLEEYFPEKETLKETLGETLGETFRIEENRLQSPIDIFFRKPEFNNKPLKVSQNCSCYAAADQLNQTIARITFDYVSDSMSEIVKNIVIVKLRKGKVDQTFFSNLLAFLGDARKIIHRNASGEADSRFGSFMGEKHIWLYDSIPVDSEKRQEICTNLFKIGESLRKGEKTTSSFKNGSDDLLKKTKDSIINAFSGSIDPEENLTYLLVREEEGLYMGGVAIFSNINFICTIHAFNDSESSIESIFDSFKKACESDTKGDLISHILEFIYDFSISSTYFRGQAAITLWIVRGIAKSKGYNIEFINGWKFENKGYPYDVAALITSDKETFCKQNIENIKLIS